jgi:hypothetical protein
MIIKYKKAFQNPSASMLLDGTTPTFQFIPTGLMISGDFLLGHMNLLMDLREEKTLR